MAYKARLEDSSAATAADFHNPWNFFGLFQDKDEQRLGGWMRSNSFIPSSMRCEVCDQDCRMVTKEDRRFGYVWRCRGTPENPHDRSYSATRFSFFENTRFDVRDILVFIWFWALQVSLRTASQMSGMFYGHTPVNWANYLRDLCRQFVYDLYYNNSFHSYKFSGDIEIDESLFGRRCKYNRGNPNPGQKVWIFGIVERSTNNIILYPVDHRDEKTLVTLIERHVEKGSRIFSDGWSAYASLNNIGYEHFTVCHKYSFKKNYRNVITGEVISVNTNRIEGAWKHAKSHFRKINGTSLANFEAHLSEIIWRNRMCGSINAITATFELIKKYYPLDRSAVLNCSDPLFDSWSKGEGDRVGSPDVSIIRCEDELPDVGLDLDLSTEREDRKSHRSIDHPSTSNNADFSHGDYDTFQQGINDAASVSEHRVSTPHQKKVHYSRKSRCPKNFEPVDEPPVKAKKQAGKGKGKAPKKTVNPYGKDNFVWDDEADDDFDF